MHPAFQGKRELAEWGELRAGRAPWLGGGGGGWDPIQAGSDRGVVAREGLQGGDEVWVKRGDSLFCSRGGEIRNRWGLG